MEFEKEKMKMKHWYVEVPITEGCLYKRFDCYEDAEKEASRIRNVYDRGEIPEIKGYMTDASVAAWKTRARLRAEHRSERIVDSSKADLKASRIKDGTK